MKNPLLSYNEDCDRHAHQTATITTTRNQIVRQIEIVAIQNRSPIVTVYTLLFVVAVAYSFFFHRKMKPFQRDKTCSQLVYCKRIDVCIPADD